MGTLLTVTQAKAYIPVEHDADDTLIGDLIDEAEARMQGYMQVPIVAAEFVEYHDGGTSILFLDRFPIQDGTVAVVDTQATVDDATDDETLEETVYRVFPAKGEIMRTTTVGYKSTWPHGHRRYKVTYTAGLDQHEDWSIIQVELRGTIRDLVAEWYTNRRPGASSIREGAGLGSDKERGELPDRVRQAWDRYCTPL